MLSKMLKHSPRCLIQSSLFACSFAKTINTPKPRGKFLIIPTPIGNLGDLSPKIIKSLFTADLIGCQDRTVAGQLYHLIRSRKIVSQMQQLFGSLGLTNLIQVNEQYAKNEQQAHSYYNYSTMSQKQRRKYLRKMPQSQQIQFRINYLKYRAKKILNKDNQWLYPSHNNRFDQLYGIDLSDMQYIENQIRNCRVKKGRGVLVPLNTYNQTKMFDMVRALLETKVVALVSDAGMPCISDPGWKLVNKIRNTMPDIPIQVIGGPSSVGVLALQASITATSNSLSGRFQGFSSLSTGNFQQKNREMKDIKMKEYSIHYINAKKLKTRLLQLQKTFGGHIKIILNNQLTKKYQRRFQGTITELMEQIDQSDFKPVGQISYLLYPPVQQNQSNIESEVNQVVEQQVQWLSRQQVDMSQTLKIQIPKFLQVVQRHNPTMRSKQKIKLLCQIFSIKTGQARSYIYQKYQKQQQQV